MSIYLGNVHMCKYANALEICEIKDIISFAHLHILQAFAH